MIGERFGHVFDKPLETVAKNIDVNPNVITITGFLITISASWVLASNLFFGGILVLFGGLFDIMDGVVARTNNRTSRFGAFLDSVLDRYSDAAIFLAVAWNLFRNNDLSGVVLAISTLVGAFLISYSRARAEGLGEDGKHGLMERPERVILVSLGAIGGFIKPALWILAVLTHFTVFQRIYRFWRLTLRNVN